MAEQVRVFISHHHSPDEDAFTTRLVGDLKTAGADVWVDDEGITSEDFVSKISEGLIDRQWLILVLTPESAASPWVRREVDAAINEVTTKRMLGVIPIVMIPTPENIIPILWRPLHRYDATHNYEAACTGLLQTFGLGISVTAPLDSGMRQTFQLTSSALMRTKPPAVTSMLRSPIPEPRAPKDEPRFLLWLSDVWTAWIARKRRVPTTVFILVGTGIVLIDVLILHRTLLEIFGNTSILLVESFAAVEACWTMVARFMGPARNARIWSLTPCFIGTWLSVNVFKFVVIAHDPVVLYVPLTNSLIVALVITILFLPIYSYLHFNLTPRDAWY